MQSRQFTSGGRYPILRTIAILWIVSAILALAYGIFQAISTLIGSTRPEVIPIHPAWGGHIGGFFVWLAITFFAVIINLAVAELIKLAIDVEYNTRMTAMSTSALATPAAGPAVVAPRTGDGTRTRMADESAESAPIRGR